MHFIFSSVEKLEMWVLGGVLFTLSSKSRNNLSCARLFDLEFVLELDQCSWGALVGFH